MLTKARPYAVAEIGRLTLRSDDTVHVAAEHCWEDDELFNLCAPRDRKELVRLHGDDGRYLISRWAFESEDEASEQREAFREMWRDHMDMRGGRQ